MVCKGQSNESIPSVKIGEQVWMSKNLDVSIFANGDLIPEAKTEHDWKTLVSLGKPAWCYYDNDSSNGKKYGRLYNWYALNDQRGLAPKGWHVAKDAEWHTLITFLGGQSLAGAVLKDRNWWALLEHFSSNKSDVGFDARPGGSLGIDFGGLTITTCWCTSAVCQFGASDIWCYTLNHNSDSVMRVSIPNSGGFSIRCIKD